MCLCIVKKKFGFNNRTEECYKIFSVHEGEIFPSHMKSHIEYSIGRHYVSNNIIINPDDPFKNYESGFHGYRSKKDAIENKYKVDKIFLVKLWDIRAIGENYWGDFDKTIVAKNMIIIKEVSIE